MSRTSEKANPWAMGSLALVVTFVSAFVGGCLRKSSLPSGPPMSSNVGKELKTKSYDDSQGGDKMLWLPYFNEGAAFLVEMVSLDGSVIHTRSDGTTIPTQPIEGGNEEAITKGESAWKVTLSQGANGWVQVFEYSFANDPFLTNDPDRPDCWIDPSACPGFRGQDWSPYSHFMADVYTDPEAPVWDEGGWWLNSYILTLQQLEGCAWYYERYVDGNGAYNLCDNVWGPCSAWYQFKESATGGTLLPGLNKMSIIMDDGDFIQDNNTALAEWAAGNRWTRKVDVHVMSFLIGGSTGGFVPGSHFYVDNPRVVRVRKPAWEGNFEAMAFAEFGYHHAGDATNAGAPPPSLPIPFTWTDSLANNYLTNSYDYYSQTFNPRKPEWKHQVNSANGQGIVLPDGYGETLSVVPTRCVEADLSPVRLTLTYRLLDENMRLLVDWNNDGTLNGMRPGGAMVLAPGDLAWHTVNFELDISPAPWDQAAINSIEFFTKAESIGLNGPTPQVEVDEFAITTPTCSPYCYHPASPNHSAWPSWRN